MKVITSLNQAFFERLPSIEKLKEKVDSIFRANKNERWHYVSRIKSQESFALKMETGRVSDPKTMEDFFGCTLVVENNVVMKEALIRIQNTFCIIEKRPKIESFTHKETHSFPFDDLRIYAKLKKDVTLPPTDLDEIIFEVQLKTFFQHAWTIATHDMIYKSEDISWAKQRVAYQIKAMIEHAELSIEGAEALSVLPSIAKENKFTQELQKTYKLIKQLWEEVDLPADMIRLSENVNSLLRVLDVTRDELKVIIEAETTCGRGTLTKDLSPYLVIIQTIINRMPAKLISYQGNQGLKNRHLLFLPKEIDTSNLLRVSSTCTI